MTIQERKEREREQREQLILKAARQLLIEQGYFGLNMDKLAEAVEYSKGTIYQHFKTKEDVIIAVAAEGMKTRSDYFSRALEFKGNSRERIVAIGAADQIFVKRHPDHFRIEQLVKVESIWDKTSQQRKEELGIGELCCSNSVITVLQQAISSGDLKLEDHRPEEILFGLWTMSLGVHTLVNSPGLLAEEGVTQPYFTLTKNMSIYLDGLGWRPLSKEWDYHKTFQRACRELFDEEATYA